MALYAVRYECKKIETFIDASDIRVPAYQNTFEEYFINNINSSENNTFFINPRMSLFIEAARGWGAQKGLPPPLQNLLSISYNDETCLSYTLLKEDQKNI